MLELDCTVLTPEEAFKTADTLINLKTGCARTKNVLEARLRGDKEARGLPVDEKDAGDKSDFRNRKGKDATQLSSMMKSSGSMRRFLKRYLPALRIKSTIHSSSF